MEVYSEKTMLTSLCSRTMLSWEMKHIRGNLLKLLRTTPNIMHGDYTLESCTKKQIIAAMNTLPTVERWSI